MNDGRPRFEVTSLSGYPPIGGGGRKKPVTSWYVKDRANCHRVLRTFVTYRGHHPSGAVTVADPEREAHRYAQQLNDEYDT